MPYPPLRSMALSLLIGFFCGPMVAADDNARDRERVLALGNLAAAPVVHPVEGFAEEDGIRPLFFEGLPYRGKPTRVFAWYGTPARREGKIPAIVLVHGGGGTAFRPWVRKWIEQGFAAISIAVEGQTDRRQADGKSWERHAWAGPARDGIYADHAEPLEDQWMYHAVADTVLANSLLRSFPEIDERKVGLMGISWGGIIASTIVGIDPRFAFAIPTYGCGRLDEADNPYKQALRTNTAYREVWEPTLRMSRATMPILWLTWLRDTHFPLDVQRSTYRAAPGPRLVAVIPDMGHSHEAGWNPPDSYAFARSIVESGRPWGRLERESLAGDKASAVFDGARPAQSATLIHTADTGFTARREWKRSPAEVRVDGTRHHVAATLPPGTRAYFFNLDASGLTLSSEFTEITPSTER